MIRQVNRPNLPVAALRSWSGTVPAQAVGVLLILAVAVVHPLQLEGTARTAVQILAVVAGFVGILVVFGGMLARTVPESGPVLAAPRAGWTSALLVALVLYAGAAGCLVQTLTDDGSDYLPAAVMLVLPAITLSLALWWTRTVWAGPAVPNAALTEPTVPEPAAD